jgi:hypothetical protein
VKNLTTGDRMRYGLIPFFLITFLCTTLLGDDAAVKKVTVPEIHTLDDMLDFLSKKPQIRYKPAELKSAKQTQTVKSRKFFFEIKGKSLEEDLKHNYCIMGDLTWRLKNSAPKNVYRGKADIMLISRDTGKIVFRNLKVKLRVLCPT